MTSDLQKDFNTIKSKIDLGGYPIERSLRVQAGVCHLLLLGALISGAHG